MSSVSVRRAVLPDLEAVAVLLDDYRQFYGRAPDLAAARAFLQERLSHEESAVFLADDGPIAVGFTQLYPCFSSVSLARTFILNDLFVVPSHRRSGVGSKLLHAAVKYAGALGAVRVTLNTDVRNRAAQATYEARGWKRDQDFYAYHIAPPD